jgi:hypothetical protein
MSRIFGFFVQATVQTRVFTASPTGGVPLLRVLSRKSEPNPPWLYRFTKELTVARFIPTTSATSAADFPFALRNTVCSRMAYLCMMVPVANSFSMMTLSSGTKVGGKLFKSPLYHVLPCLFIISAFVLDGTIECHVFILMAYTIKK